MTPKIIRGAGFRGALNYVLQARELADGRLERPPVIGGNMSGRDARSLANEFAAARKLRPEVKRPVWHCPLSLPPGEVISREKFREVAADFMAEMGFGEAHPWALVLHREKAHLHAHIIACRIALDGTVWHGQHEARRAIEACRALEKRHGLRPTPMPAKRERAQRAAVSQEMPAMITTPSEAAVRAQRRAARRGTKASDPHGLRVAVLDALPRSSTPHEFKARLLALGVEVQFSTRQAGEIYGWKLRRAGAVEWLSASSIHRDMAWSRVAAALAERAGQGQAERPTPRPPAARPSARQAQADEAERISARVHEALSRLSARDLERLREAAERRAGMATEEAIEALLHRLLDLIARVLTLGAVALGPTLAQQREAARLQLIDRIEREQRRRTERQAAQQQVQARHQAIATGTGRVVKTHDARPARAAPDFPTPEHVEYPRDIP